MKPIHSQRTSHGDAATSTRNWSKDMATLNMLVQLVGICAGLYLMFSRSFGVGAALIAVVAVGHFAFMQLSNLLMLVHQKSMREEELRELAAWARFGAETPPAWRAIATACGVAYIATVVGAIWYFVSE